MHIPETTRRRNRVSLTRASLLGTIVWIACVLGFPASPPTQGFPSLVVLFAILILFPLLHELAEREFPGISPGPIVLMLGGLSAVFAMAWPPDKVSCLLTMPWAFILAWTALRAAKILLSQRHSLSRITFLLGMMMPVIGGGWLLAARLGFRPLGFPAEIVVLTAVHFHFAGSVLPILLGIAATHQRGALATGACLGSLAGIPLVAVGITSTQLGGPAWIESICAIEMSTAGIAAAALLVRHASRSGQPATSQFLWLTASLCLATGMLFAAMYGLRPWLPTDLLTIPLMQASHGLLLAFGFAPCGVLAASGQRKLAVG